MHRVVEDCQVGVEYCPWKLNPGEESEKNLGRKAGELPSYCGAVYGKVNECLDVSYFSGSGGKGIDTISTLAIMTWPVTHVLGCTVFSKRIIRKDGTAVCSGYLGDMVGPGTYWGDGSTKPRGVRCW
jgi:hypothetical protein